jgi:leucyl aminopeptidase (aminopeptidase T)
MLEQGLGKLLEIFGLSEGEVVTVVFTPESRYLVEALERIARDIEVRSFEIPDVRDERLKEIKQEYVRSANLLLLTKESLTHHEYSQEAKSKGAKIISVPNPQKEVFERAAGFDYEKIGRLMEDVKNAVEKARIFRIVSPNGTDIILERGEREVKIDKLRVKKGRSTNFPPGEVCFAPIETRAGGKVYFDRVSYPKDGEIHYLSNVGFLVGNGRLIKPLTGEGEIIWKYLSRYEGFETIAEFAIGTNPYARFDSPIVESEKTFGTCHIAFGESRNVGGTHAAGIHKDGIIRRPTIYFDNEMFMEQGKFTRSPSGTA